MNDNTAGNNTSTETTEVDHRRYQIEHNLIGTSMSHGQGDVFAAITLIEEALAELKAGNIGTYRPPEPADWTTF